MSHHHLILIFPQTLPLIGGTNFKDASGDIKKTLLSPYTNTISEMTYRSGSKMEERARNWGWLSETCLRAERGRPIPSKSRQKQRCKSQLTKFSSFHNLQGNNLRTYLFSFWANALVVPVEVWLPELWAAMLAENNTILLVSSTARYMKARGDKTQGTFWRRGRQQLRTCITLFCTFLSRFCTTTTWKCLISRFVEDVNKQRRNFISLSELDCRPLKFSFRRVRLQLTK